MSLSVAEVCYFQERFGNAVISIDDLIIGEPVGEGEGNKHYNYSLYIKKLLLHNLQGHLERFTEAH